jgi:hypothetical protein
MRSWTRAVTAFGVVVAECSGELASQNRYAKRADVLRQTATLALRRYLYSVVCLLRELFLRWLMHPDLSFLHK